MTVGQRIEARRLQLNEAEPGRFTMDALSARLGTNRGQVSRWQQDENEPTAYRAALAIELRIEEKELTVSGNMPSVVPARDLDALRAGLAALDERLAVLEAALQDIADQLREHLDDPPDAQDGGATP